MYKKFIGSMIALISLLIISIPNETYAAKNKDSTSSVTELIAESDIYSKLDNVVYFVMAIGGFWIVGMLVWGGMTLAKSGGNPQLRTEGIIKLVLTVIGAYIIYKAHTIASWVFTLFS